MVTGALLLPLIVSHSDYYNDVAVSVIVPLTVM